MLDCVVYLVVLVGSGKWDVSSFVIVCVFGVGSGVVFGFSV